MAISIGRDGRELGDFPREDVETMIRSGTAKPDDVWWEPGMSEWKPIHEFPIAPEKKTTQSYWDGYLLAAWCALIALSMTLSVVKACVAVSHAKTSGALAESITMILGGAGIVVFYTYCIRRLLDRTISKPMIFWLFGFNGLSILIRGIVPLEVLIFAACSAVIFKRFGERWKTGEIAVPKKPEKTVPGVPEKERKAWRLRLPKFGFKTPSSIAVAIVLAVVVYAFATRYVHVGQGRVLDKWTGTVNRP